MPSRFLSSTPAVPPSPSFCFPSSSVSHRVSHYHLASSPASLASFQCLARSSVAVSSPYFSPSTASQPASASSSTPLFTSKSNPTSFRQKFRAKVSNSLPSSYSAQLPSASTCLVSSAPSSPSLSPVAPKSYSKNIATTFHSATIQKTIKKKLQNPTKSSSPKNKNTPAKGGIFLSQHLSLTYIAKSSHQRRPAT